MDSPWGGSRVAGVRAVGVGVGVGVSDAAPRRACGGRVSGQVAAFTDSDPSDTAQSWVNRVNVDWGDRSPPVAGQVSGGDGSFVIGAAHTYSAAGTYTITVSVYAGSAQPTSASAPVMVASIRSPIAVVGSQLRAGMPLSLQAGTAGQSPLPARPSTKPPLGMQAEATRRLFRYLETSGSERTQHFAHA